MRCKWPLDALEGRIFWLYITESSPVMRDVPKALISVEMDPRNYAWRQLDRIRGPFGSNQFGKSFPCGNGISEGGAEFLSMWPVHNNNILKALFFHSLGRWRKWMVHNGKHGRSVLSITRWVPIVLVKSIICGNPF